MVLGLLVVAAGWYLLLVQLFRCSSPAAYVAGLLVAVALVTEGARTTLWVEKHLIIWRPLGLFSVRRWREVKDLQTVRIEVRATGEVRLILEFSDESACLGPWESGGRRRLLSRCERAVEVLRELESKSNDRPSGD